MKSMRPDTLFNNAMSVNSTPKTIPGDDGTVSRRIGILALIGGIFSLSACGGGGGGGGDAAGDASIGGASGVPSGSGIDLAAVSSGGTGSFSVGPVTGFGSIIINGNGVRIDDSTANVTDENGIDKKGSLKLGMKVTVNSTVAVSGAVTAQSIVITSELLGRIEGTPDAGTKTFEVLGQTVLVVASTVFDASLPAGFNSLADDDIVEVHGLLDIAKNELTATFVERHTSAAYFKVQGEMRSLDAAAKVFKIDALDIDYIGTADLSLAPANGVYVQVRLAPSLPNSFDNKKVWHANRIRGAENLIANRDLFEILGRVTNLTSQATFSVDGVPVNAANAGYPNGLAVLAVGSLVEIKGRMTAGTLVATTVKLESESELANSEFELHGNVSNFTGTGVAGTFMLGTFTVNYVTASTVFDGGIAGNLLNGSRVEVKGTLGTSGSSTSIDATRIRFG
jgi:Domain of unknown function (DUF5666)